MKNIFFSPFQEKYRNDVSLAIQLLQCKPSNFVGQKYDSVRYCFIKYKFYTTIYLIVVL